MNAELLSKIQIASLEKEIHKMQTEHLALLHDYKVSLDRFQELMQRSELYNSQFPNGFVDCFIGTVIQEYQNYTKYQ